jgi:transcriptional regulator with XRE-family HTH domain
VTSQMLDVGLHEGRRERRMQDPEYRAAYERAAREVAQTDAVIQQLDSLRADLGMSKAELARRVNRNASSVRRLFTAGQVRPELPLIVALADALGAELRVVPRAAETQRVTGEPGRQRRVAATGLALADYGRPHAPLTWPASGARPVRPGLVTGSCRGRSSTTRDPMRRCPHWSSSTCARAPSTRSSRRCWTRSPRRRLRGSPAGASGRPCTGRWAAGTRSG